MFLSDYQRHGWAPGVQVATQTDFGAFAHHDHGGQEAASRLTT